MAIGKSKKLGKKGRGKKAIDPLSRKEWYQLRAPVPFNAKPFGYTLVTRTTGTKIASEQIKARVCEYSLADLKDNSDQFYWRKIRLIIDDVEGSHAKTSFYGMDVTRDKICQMIRKWQTLIDCFVDVKTADGYIMRIYIIAFTKKQGQGQVKKTSYASTSHIKDIRKKVATILTAEAAKSSINEIVRHFTTEFYPDKIKTGCQYIYPLQNITIRKVKIIKRPKIDTQKMNEMYSHEKKPAGRTTEANVEEDEAAKNTLTTTVSKEAPTTKPKSKPTKEVAKDSKPAQKK